MSINIEILSKELEDLSDNIAAKMTNSNIPTPDRYERTVYMLEAILKHYRFAQINNTLRYDFIDDLHGWRKTMFTSAYNKDDEVSQTLKSLINTHYQDITKVCTYLNYQTESFDDNDIDMFVSRIVKATWPILFNNNRYHNNSNYYVFINIPVHELQLYRISN